MNRILSATALGLAVFLAGCATTGQYNGMDPDPGRWMIVYSSVGLPLTSEQKKLVGEVVVEAAKIVDEQLGNSEEAIATGGFASAIASAIATALTVSNPIGSVMAIEAAQNAGGGVNEARTTVSYARVYAGATIAETLMLDRIEAKVPRYDILKYVHIVPAFVKSTNTLESFRR